MLRGRSSHPRTSEQTFCDSKSKVSSMKRDTMLAKKALKLITFSLLRLGLIMRLSNPDQ